MQRQPISPLIIILAVVAFLTACTPAAHYDGRLAAADSLMHDRPDSALAILQALHPDSLATQGDHAYRDLLLTQARYKCYITATTDSAINRALHYYRRHSHEQEKLTRAYIYKGAVMEELGHPDSAMHYYKTAEATAAPDDYFNLAYTKMRIATMYQDQLSQDTIAAKYEKQAIYYFTMTNDSDYLISCYGDLGGIYGLNNPDSSEFYLNRAIDIAQQFKSTKQYTYKSRLAGFYYYQYNDYPRANTLAMDVLRNGKRYSKDNQFYTYAAMSFIKMGKLDSAKYVLEMTPAPIDAVDSMNRHHVMAEIAKAEKRMESYGTHLELSKNNEIHILTNNKTERLKAAESDYHRAQAEEYGLNSKQKNRLLAIALSISLVLALSLLLLTIYLSHIIDRNKKERKAIEQSLVISILELQTKQTELQEVKNSVSEIVAYRIDALKELFDSIKFKPKDKQVDNNVRIRNIIPLSSVIGDMSDAYHVMNIKLTDKFWERISLSVDGEYPGIMSFVKKRFPSLTEKDLQLFCLLCAQLSPQIIKLCMNYSNVKTVSNYKKKLINVKMGLDMSFDDFLQRYSNGMLT